jgi:hypothetical protein
MKMNSVELSLDSPPFLPVGDIEIVYRYGVDWHKDRRLSKSPLHRWIITIIPDPYFRLLRVNQWYDSRPTMIIFHMALRGFRSFKSVWQPHDIGINLSHRLIDQNIGFQFAWF